MELPRNSRRNVLQQPQEWLVVPVVDTYEDVARDLDEDAYYISGLDEGRNVGKTTEESREAFENVRDSLKKLRDLDCIPELSWDQVREYHVRWLRLYENFKSIVQETRELTARGASVMKDPSNVSLSSLKEDEAGIGKSKHAINTLKEELYGTDACRNLGEGAKNMYAVTRKIDRLRLDVQDFRLSMRNHGSSGNLRSLHEVKALMANFGRPEEMVARLAYGQMTPISEGFAYKWPVDSRLLYQSEPRRPGVSTLERQALSEWQVNGGAEWDRHVQVCEENLTVITNYLREISGSWARLCADAASFEMQLGLTVEGNPNRELFRMRLRITTAMYARLHEALVDFARGRISGRKVHGWAADHPRIQTSDILRVRSRESQDSDSVPGSTTAASSACPPFTYEGIKYSALNTTHVQRGLDSLYCAPPPADLAISEERIRDLSRHHSKSLEEARRLPKRIADIRTSFRTVRKQLKRLRQIYDKDAVRRYYAMWRELGETFEAIVQEVQRLAAKGARRVKDFACDFCDFLGNKSGSITLEAKAQELARFKDEIFAEQSMLFSRDTRSTYPLATNIVCLQNGVHNFGFEISIGSFSGKEAFLREIESLERELSMMKFKGPEGFDPSDNSRNLGPWSGVATVLSVFNGDRDALDAFVKASKTHKQDDYDSPNARQLRRTIAEKKNTVANRNHVWGSSTQRCGAQINEVTNQLLAISNLWVALCSDIVELENQLNLAMMNEAHSDAFYGGLGTMQRLYGYIYEILFEVTRVKAPSIGARFRPIAFRKGTRNGAIRRFLFFLR